MYNSDAELLFPERVLTDLKDERGPVWRALLERIESSAPDSAERAGFVLLMARLNGCASCNADSFRAMRGCTQCALQTIRRYRGKDEELVRLYEKACHEIAKFLAKEIERK